MITNQEESIIIGPETTILQSLKRMDEIRHKLLLVIHNGKYLGLLSIGDIQRAIINNVDLANAIATIMRDDYIIANPESTIEEIKRQMIQIRSEFMPVVTQDLILVKVYFWNDLFREKVSDSAIRFNLPVVIMAGGFGTRLKPLTNVIPKPLIPIGNKTMLEEIFDRFGKFGCNDFYISVNYKSSLIKYYIQELNLPIHIEYFEEKNPMGTAGSLSLLRGKIDQTFFVTNCDILIDDDYSEFLKYHKENKNEITVVAALKNFPIAYGTIETGENGQLLTMVEKPEVTFKINSGMYILEPHLIDEIPEDQFFHITDLINKLHFEGRPVGVFPVTPKSWIDIGDWKEYLDIIKQQNNHNVLNW